MKFFKWKSFFITSAVCLLPILLGVSVWDKLPDTMAIHFNVYGVADNFASKGFVVFGMPILMVLLQAISCVINDMNAKRFGERKKFEAVTKWIVPVITVALQIITLGYGLGWALDIRRAVGFLVGVLFIVLGNYLPKFDRLNNVNADAETARKVNRFIGYQTVVMGILFLLTIFLPPVSTVICLFLLIPYAVIGVIYGVRQVKKR